MQKTKNANIALIVAAGRGSRISQASDDDTPKQYIDIAGKSVLQRTIEAFQKSNDIDHIIVVIHADDVKTYLANIPSDTHKLLDHAIGGATRQQSVCLGLQSLKAFGAKSKVLIHDAARPFVSTHTIGEVCEAIGTDCGALPALPIADTVKRNKIGTKNIIETIDRSGLYGAQTPQGFMLGEIAKLHHKAAQDANSTFTDDASIFEAHNKQIRIVEGSTSNFKITTLDDLDRARMMVTNGSNNITDKEYRTGNGYDVHAFTDGDAVILCGVKIPYERKLKGHSDADVGLHALTDALLGTIGVGDIGTFFPPSDPQWKDANSDQFLKAACNMIGENGGRICNLDVTLICEAPKIGPHRIGMINHIADICNVNSKRVSVKATTNEKLGFLGRQEGIAAMASVSVEFARTENE